jgi:branched-chain amino acid transport system substrate-binding protein
MRLALLPILVLTAGCAGSHAYAPAAEAFPSGEEAAKPRSVDEAALEWAEEALEDGRPVEAAWIADSLVSIWAPVSGLDEGTIRRLARLHMELAEDARAAVLLAAVPGRPGGRTLSLLREATSRLSQEELEGIVPLADHSGRVLAVVLAELAYALAQAGQTDSAMIVARRVVEGDAEREERRTAGRVLDGKVEANGTPAKIGLILPGTGRFAAVGAQLLEGALLAVAERRRLAPALEVELVVVHDSSRTDIGADLLRELEEGGVVGVVGPIRSEALLAVAGARRSAGLVIVSPTASEDAGLPFNSYSLWQRERRDTEAAVRLAEWMTSELRLTRFGILYPHSADVGSLQAFQETVEESGGVLIGAFPYDSDSTTFEAPISALGQLEPEGVLVLADNPRTVLQIAPQLVYYGLRSKIISGGANWSDPEVVRRLDPSYADFRLVATYLDRVNPGTGWMRFKNSYEAEYRKALPDNMFVALGYDATGPLSPTTGARAHWRGGWR